MRTYLVDVLDWAGADAVEAEELAVVPGLDEVFALADIKTFATSGDYDVVVVDCAPTAETIRLLSLPDVLGWYMDRVFETQRRHHERWSGRSCSASRAFRWPAKACSARCAASTTGSTACASC